MYLSVLDLETKHLFLDLELYISKTDGEFNDLEKQIIDTHCIEMHIDNNNYQCELPLSVVYEKLGKCTEEEKRIIFIEMLAVVLADKVYANSHFPRPARPHFPASQGHIKRSALEIGRARGAPPC